MSSEISIKLEDVTISHPENIVFSNLDLEVQKGDFIYILYRAINGGGFNIIKTLDSSQTQYIDKIIKYKISYEYAIQVQYSESKKSGFSPIKKITLN